MNLSLLALVKIMMNAQMTRTIAHKVYHSEMINHLHRVYLACTNLDILNATTNPEGHPFECSCPLHYGGDPKLCDLIG